VPFLHHIDRFKLSLVKSASTAAALSPSTQFVYRPPDYPVALGGFGNNDPRLLSDKGSAPAWGTPENPIPLQDLADGQTGPPRGLQTKVYNRYIRQALFVTHRPNASSCRATERCHSITSSARDRNSGGIVMPSALAVLRFTTKYNLVGCEIGRSPGFAPLKILSMYPTDCATKSA
jgi:hypothetical protein